MLVRMRMRACAKSAVRIRVPSFARASEMARRTVLSVSALLIALLAARVQLISARRNSRDTTLATFNTGLVSGAIGNVDARVAVLVDQMIQSDVDIYCLQEVFGADVQRKIRNDLRKYYPYALSPIDLDTEPTSTAPACDETAVTNFFSCRAERCAGRTGLAFGFCALLACPLNELSASCLRCLFFEVSISNVTECTSTIPASTYDTTYGLMLLSNKELKNPTVHPFNNQSQIRGFLTASVEGVGDLVCTHLSTNIPPPPLYAGPPFVTPFLYTSYAEQQGDELRTLFSYIETSGVDVPILLGDFNHGPASPGGLRSQFPFYYGLLNVRGFVSPYILKDGRCTFCTENPLTNGAYDRLIDHIYITTDTTERVLAAKRFHDIVFPSIGTAISDHYGVKVRLSNIREGCNYIQRCRFHCVEEIKELAPLQLDYSEICFD